MSAVVALDLGRPMTREEHLVSDRYHVEMILDELHDLERSPLKWPSAAADRYDELHRRLGFFASLHGINWPPASRSPRGDLFEEVAQHGTA